MLESDPLFPLAPPVEYLCSNCRGTREIESHQDGVTQYKPCAACGEIAIERKGDEYVAPRIRKPHREEIGRAHV